MTNNLVYDDSGIKFLLLNILGHDVIHDYGGNSTSDRWSKNFEIVTQFNGSFTFSSIGGSPYGSETMVLSNQSSTGTSSGYSIFPNRNTNANQKSQFPQRQGRFLGNKTEQEIEKDFYKFIEGLKNSCIFSMFYYKIYENISETWSLQDFFLGAFGFFIVSVTDPRYEKVDEIFISVCYSFLDYLYNNSIELQGPKFMLSFENYYDLLDGYLSTNLLEERILLSLAQGYISSEGIYNIPSSEEIREKRKRRFGDISGGAKAKDESFNTEEDVLKIINELNNYRNTYLTNEKLLTLGKIYRKFKENDGKITSDENLTYENARKTMLTELKNILTNYKQNLLSGEVDNASSNDRNINSFIPKLKTGKTPINSDEEFVSKGANNFFNEFVYGKYQKKLDKYQEERDELARKEANEALQKAKQLEGKLSTYEINIRKNFVRIVAKTALYLNGICDGNGMLQKNYQDLIDETKLNDSNYFLREEIIILLNESEWRQFFGVSNLDDYLYTITKNFFNNVMKSDVNDASIYCDVKAQPTNTTNSKYIINNAAFLDGNGIKNRVFCSNSSILDGMPQCSPKTSEDQLEIGNMDFTIINNSQNYFYRGIATMLGPNMQEVTKIDQDAKNIRFVKYNINIKTINGTQIIPENVYNELNMKNPFLEIDRRLSSSPLEAYHVLRITLLLFIKKIELLYTTNRSEYDEIIRTSVILANEELNASKKQKTSSASSLSNMQLKKINFFENFFNLQLNNHNNDTNYFFNILANIYYKGCGDLYQEINCVAKNGGYSDPKVYYADDTIKRWNFKNDQLRMFLAKDQPSACRFAFLLMFGKDNTINNYAFGGYSGGGEKVLIVSKRYYKNTNPKLSIRDMVCIVPQSNVIGGRKGLKRITKKRFRKTKKTIKNNRQTHKNKK